MAGRYHALQDRYRRLHTDSQLLEIVQDLQDITREAAGLTSDIARLRSRGYVYATYLERKAALLYEHWQTTVRNIQLAFDARLKTVRESYSQLQAQSRWLSEKTEEVPSDDLLSYAESAVTGLESDIRAAETDIRQMYAVLERDINQTIEQIQEIHWLLDQRDASGIVFRPGESLFMGTFAAVSLPLFEPRDGVLYLTTQRLLFEQNRVSPAAENSDIGDSAPPPEWEINLGQVEDVSAQHTGTVDRADLLHISYLQRNKTVVVTAAIHGWAKCKLWAAHIRRLRFGDAADERAILPDDELLSDAHGALANCHICGAMLTTSETSRSRICDYCGANISS